MRARMIFLVAAILLVAGFAALNWSEMMRTSPLSFGVVVTDAPLGLIMLVLLLASIVVFIAGSAVQQTQSLMDARQYAKALQTQRELADVAEASRFTELRRHLDMHHEQLGRQMAAWPAELEARLAEQRRIDQRLDQREAASML